MSEVTNEVLQDELSERGLLPLVLYVVVGTQGRYSDRCEWMVAAYLNVARAEAHAKRLTEWTQAMARLIKEEGWRYDYDDDAIIKSQGLHQDPLAPDYGLDFERVYNVSRLLLTADAEDFLKATGNADLLKALRGPV